MFVGKALWIRFHCNLLSFESFVTRYLQRSRNSTAESMSIILLHVSPWNSLPHLSDLNWCCLTHSRVSSSDDSIKSTATSSSSLSDQRIKENRRNWKSFCPKAFFLWSSKIKYYFNSAKKFSFFFEFWFISSWNRIWPILSMWCSPWKFKAFLFGLSYIHTSQNYIDR